MPLLEMFRSYRFEYCYWKHSDRMCAFEWKRASGAVEKQACAGFKDRINYVGDYNQHECKIELTNVNSYDNGSWICEIESYVLGDHVSGYKESALIQVLVLPQEGKING